MPIHISYAEKELTNERRASQPANAALAQATQYSLLLKNRSAQPWIFFVYQRLPRLHAGYLLLGLVLLPLSDPSRRSDQVHVGNRLSAGSMFSVDSQSRSPASTSPACSTS